jgi:hypothetical protein
VDVHILRALHPAGCVARGNFHAGADVTAGTWFVVVDSYVAGGVSMEGAFHVDIGFLAPSRGPCELQVGEMPRVNDGGDHLAMPATGPVVLEAHLVTQEEPPPTRPRPPRSWPSTTPSRRRAPGWSCTAARPGRRWRAALLRLRHRLAHAFPVEDEGWYVNMYWTSAARRPGARG